MSFGKLILVRHGLSVYNDQNRFTGWKDVELNEQGISEAEQAVDLLENINFDIAFTSKLKRANDTLDIILKGIKQTSIPVEKNLALNERDYGDLIGQNKAEAAKEFGEEQVQIWRRSFDIPPPLTKRNSKHDPNIDDLYSEIKSELPLGESLKDVVSRVKSTYQQILSLSIEKKVIVVAHGNSIRAMVKMLDKLSDEEIIKINIPTGIPLAYNISNNNIEKIGYLGDEEAISNLTKEVEMQSKIADKKG